MGRSRGPTGSTVLAALQGSESDGEVIRLACHLAREREATLRGLYVVEVPQTHSLANWHEAEEDLARATLAEAEKAAQAAGCTLLGRVMPARDAGQAIVDEALDRAAELVVLAMPHRSRRGDAAFYVLRKALSNVVLLRRAGVAVEQLPRRGIEPV